jgi:hypothetical protein
MGKWIACITLMLGIQAVLVAQDLTVHVVTDSSHPKSVAGIAVQLFPQPSMPGSRKVIIEKSDSSGKVVFHNIDLTSIAWSVGIYNLVTMSTDHTLILCRPENASSQGVRPTITSLPADVTLHIRRRGFGERLQYLFVGP